MSLKSSGSSIFAPYDMFNILLNKRTILKLFRTLKKQFTLNIDQKVSAFFKKGNLITYCGQYFGATDSQVEEGLRGKQDRDDFEKAIKVGILIF